MYGFIFPPLLLSADETASKGFLSQAWCPFGRFRLKGGKIERGGARLYDGQDNDNDVMQLHDGFLRDILHVYFMPSI